MKRIVWNEPERVIEFLASRVDAERFGPDARAIGLESDGKLIASVVYEGRSGANILMHVASDGSRHWMTPAYMAACFRYPFIQLGCNRITGLVRADNIEAQRFDEHMGFKREGQLRAACTDGMDLIVYGMLKSECRFIEGKYHAALLADIRRAGLAG
ncbi:GNAT family N-acetyltransferase [Burkholderia multivorans]|jgi:RimJ/RimL family protein N-acetyltransferase|uniref:GNAT family N-acetyltransferase n=1 Tax=Burkholderia multivorans TaxID=87883 RepID=UPI000D00C772|nr:GNAT family protein [Burkholderia multivorans]MBU9261971.1 GNAT family N-acetyltransferase [Burkholderia multivorans]PRF91709.1 N-acetyltransferase [Burkholderia multivorans]